MSCLARDTFETKEVISQDYVYVVHYYEPMVAYNIWIRYWHVIVAHVVVRLSGPVVTASANNNNSNKGFLLSNYAENAVILCNTLLQYFHNMHSGNNIEIFPNCTSLQLNAFKKSMHFKKIYANYSWHTHIVLLFLFSVLPHFV